MKARDAIRAAEWVLLPLLLIVGSFYAGRYVGRVQAVGTMVAKTDTVVRIVTQYKDFPQPAKTALAGFVPVPRYMFLTDTITRVERAEIAVHDTTLVYLPREQQYYEEAEGRLRLWVSGYDPRLDRWEMDERQAIVTQTMTPRRSRWSLGVSTGYGVTLSGGAVRLSPSVVIGATYSLIYF